jgi:tRNA pseudouridine13 synthase
MGDDAVNVQAFGVVPVMSLPVWQRSHGEPLFSARLRSQPEDFVVIEELGWEPSGDGEHDYLLIEKTGANTDWVATQLAQYAGVPVKDVGFAGLKDRHAVTQQWFSVPRWHSPEWSALNLEGVVVLEVTRHLRKLRRGAHRANQFCIVLRDLVPSAPAAIDERIEIIARHGVPNYFGEQRFGRNGGNLQLAEDWARGKRLSRPKRSLAISTIRAFHFNQALSQRVTEGTWDQLLAGDLANLEGSASVFEVPVVDETLRRRCVDKDIHPAGALAGAETEGLPEHWRSALARARVEVGTRAFRLCVRGLETHQTDTSLTLRFTLPRGAYATAVLRELCEWG